MTAWRSGVAPRGQAGRQRFSPSTLPPGNPAPRLPPARPGPPRPGVPPRGHGAARRNVARPAPSVARPSLRTHRKPPSPTAGPHQGRPANCPEVPHASARCLPGLPRGLPSPPRLGTRGLRLFHNWPLADHVIASASRPVLQRSTIRPHEPPLGRSPRLGCPLRTTASSGLPRLLDARSTRRALGSPCLLDRLAVCRCLPASSLKHTFNPVRNPSRGPAGSLQAGCSGPHGPESVMRIPLIKADAISHSLIWPKIFMDAPPGFPRPPPPLAEPD
jgi:hypothetical protein